MTRIGMLLSSMAILFNSLAAGMYLEFGNLWVASGFFIAATLFAVSGCLQIPSTEKPMQNRSNQPKDAPLSREQAINVQRELERKRRKHENHEMMRRGTFRPNMRNSKRGRKK